MKTYRGIREPLRHVRVLEGAGDAAPSLPPPLPGANAVWPGGRVLALPRELVSQATAPFDWGRDGPGAHYLAVALLADLLGPADRAGIKSALPFMRRFLSRLPSDGFEISDTVFRAFVYAVAASAPAPASRTPPGQPALPGAAAAHEPSRQDSRSHADKSDRPERIPHADNGAP